MTVLDISLVHGCVVSLVWRCGTQLAVRNALRYFPSSLHATLAAEFSEELQRYGHIYMYRFMPHFTIRYENEMKMI